MLKYILFIFYCFLIWVPYWGNAKVIPDIGQPLPSLSFCKGGPSSLLYYIYQSGSSKNMNGCAVAEKTFACYKGDEKPRTTNYN